MISKKQALRFILLANFILLAHIAIPHHHHHHLQICYAADSCTHQQESEPHGTADSDFACCMSEFVPISSNPSFRLYPILPAASALHLPLFLLPENHLCRVAPVSLIQAGPAPFPDSFYTSIASASIGLRAPPII
ncbi:MAG: DUF6769 family protein [Bacteroidales bacterium]